MTTLTVNISEDSLHHLKTLANQERTTPEDLARAVIEEALQQPDTEFEQLQKNAELYRQLATL